MSEFDKARSILTSDSLGEIVDMVFYVENPNDSLDRIFVAESAEGSVKWLRRNGNGENSSFEILSATGNNPLSNQDPNAYFELEEERNHKYLKRNENSYPFAFKNISKLFDHRAHPDFFVLHTPSHNFEERGGHRGEHGSLDVIQSRAPLIVSGSGAKQLGRVDGYCRLLDIAPTILGVLGIPESAMGLNGNGGKCLDHLIDKDQMPDLAIGMLLDGANASVLYNLAEAGVLPNIKWLMERGSWLEKGAFSCLPSVTLPNHTAIMTGRYPSDHGILHNAWYDKELKMQIVTESPTTWHLATSWLFPGVQTIWTAINENYPDWFTCSVDEPVDKGAKYSSFDFFRNNTVFKLFPDETLVKAYSDSEYFDTVNNYKFGQLADISALNQACSLLRGDFLGESFEKVKFMWISFTLTDAAFHHGGPYSKIASQSLVDTDKKIGQIIEVLTDLNRLDDTFFLLVADHGMEETNPEVKGDWDNELAERGICFRDESYGFIYLT